MTVWVTKDYWDGSRSKAKEMDLDGMPMSSLAFMMMEAGVAGITITNKESVSRMVEQATGQERGACSPEKPSES